MPPKKTAASKKRALSPDKTTDKAARKERPAPAKRARASTVHTSATEDAPSAPAPVPATTAAAVGAVSAATTATQPAPAANVAAPNVHVPITAAATQADVDDLAKPKYAGTFDLYGMELPFLKDVYFPGQKAEELHKTILTYQAKDDRTARIVFPKNTSGEGEFICTIIRDPMEEMPFDRISASGITEVKDIKFKSKYGRPTQGVWNGGGVKAHLEIDNPGCGIASSKGTISLHPMWRKVEKDGKVLELFEGTFTFRVNYSGLYSRKGHGKGETLSLDVWAVRGKGKDGI
ncbi:hypothetical protein CPC08DRAFT_708791 [Agrocybe pediades]|nr:hypothetical protein CPC08DRAFT_708791 [Agrocybe pediades]